jgi:hypothetical protein
MQGEQKKGLSALTIGLIVGGMGLAVMAAGGVALHLHLKDRAAMAAYEAKFAAKDRENAKAWADQHSGSANQIVDQSRRQVLYDAIKHYDLVSQSEGGGVQRCVQAGLVVAAAIQAQDADELKKWQLTQKSDCARAGIRQ